MTVALMMGACSKPAPKKSEAPPPEVAVVKVHAQSVPLTRELVGRLAAIRVAQVRARVAGIILKQVYTEGTDVKQGQVLFRIDPAPLTATLHAQEAALAKAKADAVNAELTAKRYTKLRGKGLISEQDLDTAMAAKRTTAAAVKQAQANVESARLDLGYATVVAPINGRAGRALVDEGSLVGQGEATQLTTVEQIDPIYVNFSQSVSELEQMQAEAAAGQDMPPPEHKVKVDVILPDGSMYPHPGSLDFSDLAVDPGTGSVSMRGVLPNPRHRLLPGMFVNLRLTMGELQNAYLVPQAAVARDDAGAYVMVVDADGKVRKQAVSTHGMTRSDWIITGRLADGARVIVAGLQKVKPGDAAKAMPADGEQTGGDQKGNSES
ncbi:MAG TPA: efflux RND transporter periplasmic adaptor subunit [Gammaproteobacteria bacterium]|nr:efflux RND transporter periplasmic adaptor subunit [Gammaproteobacteria bacterium]